MKTEQEKRSSLRLGEIFSPLYKVSVRGSVFADAREQSVRPCSAPGFRARRSTPSIRKRAWILPRVGRVLSRGWRSFYVVSSVLSYILSVLMIRLSHNIVRQHAAGRCSKRSCLCLSGIVGPRAGGRSHQPHLVRYRYGQRFAFQRYFAGGNRVSSPLSGAFDRHDVDVSRCCSACLWSRSRYPCSYHDQAQPVRAPAVPQAFRRSWPQLNGFSEEMLSGLKTITRLRHGNEEMYRKILCNRNTEAVDAYYAADYYGSLIGPSVNFVNNLGTVLISTAGSPAVSVQLDLDRRHICVSAVFAQVFRSDQRICQHHGRDPVGARGGGARVPAVGRDSEAPDAPERPSDSTRCRRMRRVRARALRLCSTACPSSRTLSFRAEAGQTVAIVGPTGAGKTTLVNLLMRFYDPQGGRILIDGRDIRSYTRKSLRGGVHDGLAGYMAV